MSWRKLVVSFQANACDRVVNVTQIERLFEEGGIVIQHGNADSERPSPQRRFGNFEAIKSLGTLAGSP